MIPIICVFNLFLKELAYFIVPNSIGNPFQCERIVKLQKKIVRITSLSKYMLTQNQYLNHLNY